MISVDAAVEAAFGLTDFTLGQAFSAVWRYRCGSLPYMTRMRDDVNTLDHCTHSLFEAFHDDDRVIRDLSDLDRNAVLEKARSAWAAALADGAALAGAAS